MEDINETTFADLKIELEAKTTEELESTFAANRSRLEQIEQTRSWGTDKGEKARLQLEVSAIGDIVLDRMVS